MRIEVFSDVACPWCYIGKRNLDAALERFEHGDEVEVVWRSFQLAPDLPADPRQTSAEMLASKYGVPEDEARAMNERVTAVAAAAGIEYHLDRALPSNTFDAHRLAHQAAAAGRGEEALERLFAAYFTDGRRLADPETLAAIGRELGLAPLEPGAYADEVRADVAEAAALGLGGVPAFVIDRAYLVSGAQSPDTLLGALRRAWEAPASTAA
jgi:predicted DsbA family dithiol-disulfide isomerase